MDYQPINFFRLFNKQKQQQKNRSKFTNFVYHVRIGFKYDKFGFNPSRTSLGSPLQKVIQIAEIHFWPKKFSTKKHKFRQIRLRDKTPQIASQP